MFHESLLSWLKTTRPFRSTESLESEHSYNLGLCKFGNSFVFTSLQHMAALTVVEL